VPRAVAVAALLVLIVPGVGQVQFLVPNPEVLTNGAAELLDQALGLPYIGEQIGAIDQAAVTRLVQSGEGFAVPAESPTTDEETSVRAFGERKR
jgi:hypothetical protein